MATINNNKVMTLEEAINLVMEVKNCSLPWEDKHYEALNIALQCMEKVHKHKML